MVRIKQSSRYVHVGATFGKWTVVGPPFSIGRDNDFQSVCRCTCGRIGVVTVRNLRSGQSLGCKPCGYRWKYKCGHKRLHRIWHGMRSRCYRDYDINYHNYGGRGITVCDEWNRDFDAFAEWALANGYADTREIDRIDNDGNYTPDNCRFVTRVQNSNNRRTNKRFFGFGESRTISEWAADERCVVSYQTIQYRLIHGWSVERAMTASTRALA